MAAVNFYTQEFMSPTEPNAKVNVYYPMNAALRSQDIEQIRPFWGYIELLQRALLHARWFAPERSYCHQLPSSAVVCILIAAPVAE